MYEPYGLAQRMALIRYYFKEVPRTTSEYANLWAELVFALEFDGKLKTIERKKA